MEMAKKYFYCRNEGFKAYREAVVLRELANKPKKLGTFGAAYLYSVFKQIGIIKKSEATE